MIRIFSTIVMVGLLVVTHDSALRAADWPQFLGQDRTGHSAEKGLNLDWQKNPPKTLWKSPIGAGFSSVAVVGERIYTMVNRGERDLVICVNTKDGKDVWTFDGAPKYLDQQKQGPGPRATPTFHQGRLYCQFANGELYCLKAEDGKEVWKANIFTDTGAANPASEFYYWGISSSALVEGDLVITQPGGTKGNSVAAFHKDTGKLVWKVGDDPNGYGSIIAADLGGKRQLIVPTGPAVLGLEPTKGTILWRHVFGNKFNCNCATPLVVKDSVFYSSAYRAGSTFFQLSEESGKFAVKEKWKQAQFGNQFTTSVIVGDHVYGCHGDFGRVEFACVELASGKVKWTDSRPAKCGLIAVENHLIVLSERGTVRLLEANPEEYRVRGELKDILTYKTWASPALANGRLYIRDDKNLICVDLTKGK